MDERPDLEKELLNDEQASLLLMKDYVARGKTREDPGRVQKGWQNVERRLPKRPLYRPLMGLLSVAAAVAIVMHWRDLGEEVQQQTVKGDDGVRYVLTVIALASEDPIQDGVKVPVGTKAALRLQVTQDSYVSAFRQSDVEPQPVWLVRGQKVQAGGEETLGTAEQMYIYTFDQEGERMTFCALVALTPEDLAKKEQQAAVDSMCQTITAGSF